MKLKSTPSNMFIFDQCFAKRLAAPRGTAEEGRGACLGTVPVEHPDFGGWLSFSTVA